MPSRNVLKIDVAEQYYHVYARGASRQNIFLEPVDYEVYLKLFRRYLSSEEIRDSAGIPYTKLHESIELLCYCLMPNHFHLLVYQIDEGAMQRLMHGVMTVYSRYFNKKYQRSGSLFESRYKASLITSDTYLFHVSRYIHLNPKTWRNYPYSSLRYYAHPHSEDWLHEERIIDLFKNRTKYMEFVADYEAAKAVLDTIKHELANDI